MLRSFIDGTDTVLNRHECVHESKDVPWHHIYRYRQGSCGVLYESRPPIILCLVQAPVGLSIKLIRFSVHQTIKAYWNSTFHSSCRYGRGISPLVVIVSCWCHSTNRQTASRWGQRTGVCLSEGYPWSTFSVLLNSDIISIFQIDKLTLEEKISLYILWDGMLL